MRVLDSLTIDCMLMLVVAILMAAHTLQYRSQFVTGLAFLLGYTTVALSQEAVYSLIAGVILGIGLVSIVLKMGWFELEVFGILSSYLNHLYWLYGILGIHGLKGATSRSTTPAWLCFSSTGRSFVFHMLFARSRRSQRNAFPLSPQF